VLTETGSTLTRDGFESVLQQKTCLHHWTRGRCERTTGQQSTVKNARSGGGERGMRGESWSNCLIKSVVEWLLVATLEPAVGARIH
jgi:hypothetical protein